MPQLHPPEPGPAQPSTHRLAEIAIATAPYVVATLPRPGQESDSGVTCTAPDWAAVHKGRASSSTNQLKRLEAEAAHLQRVLALWEEHHA